MVQEASIQLDADGEEASTKRQRLQFVQPDISMLLPDDDDELPVLLKKADERMRRKCVDPSAPDVSLRGCGHILHMNCYQSHFAQFYQKNRQEISDLGISLNDGQFCCPLCQSVCNAAVPIDQSVKMAPLGMTEATSMPVMEFLQNAELIYANETKASSKLALAQQRVGMMLWLYPPPGVATSALLMAAPVAAALQDELTEDEGQRDPMLRQVWVGSKALAGGMEHGDHLVGTELWAALRVPEKCLHLDPLLTFTRLLLALPAARRGACARPLFLLIGALTIVKKQPFALFSERVARVLDACGMTKDLDLLPSEANAAEWCKAIPSGSSPGVSSVSFADGRLSFQLAALPRVLQEKAWFQNAVEWQCSVCGTTPERPAICLICGTRVCKNNNCCRSDMGDGECTQHNLSAHPNSAGLFFEIKDSTVLILRIGADSSGSIWKSPYLDPYGEPDHGLARGLAVTLHDPIIEELRRRFICGTIIDLTINTGRRLMLASWRVF